MSVYDVYVLMFDALDTIYDEAPNMELGNYLSGLNPFLFEGEGSADPAEYDEFKDAYMKVFENDIPTAENTFSFCRDYLDKNAPKEVINAFEKINIEDWIYSFDENQ